MQPVCLKPANHPNLSKIKKGLSKAPFFYPKKVSNLAAQRAGGILVCPVSLAAEASRLVISCCINVTNLRPMLAQEPGIQLLDGKSASAILYEILTHAREIYPDLLAIESWPNAGDFRKQYVDLLPKFEAARLASKQRDAIACHLAEALAQRIIWQDGEHSEPLSQHLNVAGKSLPLKSIAGNGSHGWAPHFDYGDQQYNDFRQLGTALADRAVITEAAAESLNWIQTNIISSGQIRLPNRKIVIMGAAAEMAPTEMFLHSGADILWIDPAPPPADWVKQHTFSGTLNVPDGNADLLTQPREILATIIAFAGGEPVDLCLYAYAPGQAREMRLTGAMNALIDHLPRKLVATVTMLISPTTPSELSSSELDRIHNRLDQRPGWEALLDMLGFLGRGGGVAVQDQAAASRSIVSIQGASYQAAQYLGKVMTAENWARNIRMSANTAAITQTRSLNHPVFDAAFGGAAALQVETLTPEQSRCINGLLAISDWLQPERPVPGRVRVHGGIHTLPYPLEYALRPAAAIGFAKSPRLLGKLVFGR